MTLKIPDDILSAARLDGQGALLELACRLFDIERLSLGQACRLAGRNRTQFEDELHERGIPIYRYTLEDFRQDQEAIAKMREQE